MGTNGIEYTTNDVTETVGTSGEIITIDNPLVTDALIAKSMASKLATYFSKRATLDLSWRADVRLDALDVVTNENPYETNTVLMTDIEYKFNGAFRATGKGKVI